MIIIIILKSVYIVKCTDLSNLFNFFTLFLTVKKYFHWETTSLEFFFFHGMLPIMLIVQYSNRLCKQKLW